MAEVRRNRTYPALFYSTTHGFEDRINGFLGLLLTSLIIVFFIYLTFWLLWNSTVFSVQWDEEWDENMTRKLNKI